MPKLTERFIDSFKPEGSSKDRLTFDTVTRGLGVRAYRTRGDGVTAGIERVFLVQWTDKATGRKQRVPLGLWGAITLEQARGAAQARLGRVAQGINPAAERASAKAADEASRVAAAAAKETARFTLEGLIDDWMKLHLASRRVRYSTEAERALRHAFAAHLAKPAAALTHEAVTAILDRQVAAGHPPMAARTMAYGRACYSWALKRRRLTLNPFAGLPSIERGAPARDRVLTDTEIGAVWRAAGTLGEPFGTITKLLLLTAQRREEVAGLRWSELALDLATWTVPSARTKNAKAHVVHLSQPARLLLGAVRRVEGQELVFSTTGATPPSGFSRAKTKVDAGMAQEAAADLPPRSKKHKRGGNCIALGWRFHDFRRSAVTWLAGAGFPPHVADRLLNHVTGSIGGVAAIYQRAEFLAERKAALEAWGAHVLRCGEGASADGNMK
ncbi:tyrosine-type recombinase/integrase [Plastoroseomonas arctica]|uniref:Site-specific integrase n=1 Tax=Plastoroseomonas arctica TaxID=1509237 RepID=A0AAF1JYS2_9PROT|nr:site-specific integrase [Plastoroseomonas arctica]